MGKHTPGLDPERVDDLMRGIGRADPGGDDPTPWYKEALEYIKKLEGDRKDLLAALKWFKGLLDSQFLVRDITHDGDPDWPIRMVKFTQELQTAMEAIDKAEGES